MMNCIIDTGGGNRGVFGAGVFERLLDEKIMFDCCIGVSAGSANVITYLAGQKGRLYRFYHDYAFRKQYMSLYNLIKNGEYISLDYIYSAITNSDGEDPLNFENAKKYKGIMELVATDGETASPVYFHTDDVIQDDFWCLKASCAIPFVCKPVLKNGHTYYDGGISDPVPIDRALELGCDKIVLVISKPEEMRKSSKVDACGAKVLKKKNPALAEKLQSRIDNYNSSLQKAMQLQMEGKCLIVAPRDCCNVGTLKKTPESIDALYRSGYKEAEKIREFLNK